jgi:raffinose/stachyose/melibiose transport system permease protein
MKTLRRFLFLIGALLIAIVMLFPFFWGFILSFKDNYGIFNEPTSLPKTWDWLKYIDTFKTAHLGILFKNSVIVASITTVVALFINFLSSFPIARLHHRNPGFGNFFYYLFLAATAVPIFSVLWPYYQISIALKPLGLGVDSIFGLPWPYIAGSIPLGTLVFVGGLKAIPLEMEEAALMDGCSLLKIVFLIELPLVIPIFTSLLIFNFLGAWNEFTLASILLNSNKNYTIPLAASVFREEYSMDYGAVMRAVIMVLIPQIIFYYIFQRRIIEGMTTQGLKG